MSMDVGGAKGGLKGDINVTPLVDVMLVLLIIMMLIAPMLQQGVPVQLPKADNTNDKPETQDQTVLHIDKDGMFFVNSLPIAAADVVSTVQRALEDKTEKIVLIKGDVDASYGKVMEIMDDLREVQIENVGLIVDPKTPLVQPRGGN
ncbi:MAG: biopolymer transporter ExbD [Acidobacteriota bacterium]|nr:biopolymer transporter ExbD [Acidobacteriota bacterium]